MTCLVATSTIALSRITSSGQLVTLISFITPFLFRLPAQMASASLVNTLDSMALMMPFVTCTLRLRSLSIFSVMSPSSLTVNTSLLISRRLLLMSVLTSVNATRSLKRALSSSLLLVTRLRRLSSALITFAEVFVSSFLSTLPLPLSHLRPQLSRIMPPSFQYSVDPRLNNTFVSSFQRRNG